MLQWQWHLTWSLNVPCHDTCNINICSWDRADHVNKRTTCWSNEKTERTRKWSHSSRGGACRGMALPMGLVDCWILDSLKPRLTRISPPWTCSRILQTDPLQPLSHPTDFRNRPLIIYSELHRTQSTPMNWWINSPAMDLVHFCAWPIQVGSFIDFMEWLGAGGIHFLLWVSLCQCCIHNWAFMMCCSSCPMHFTGLTPDTHLQWTRPIARQRNKKYLQMQTLKSELRLPICERCHHRL